jgi:predicted metal-dependent phosphoesterase TrpH
MTVVRTLAGALLAVAVAAGTLIDRRPQPQVRKYGDYFVLQGDFHVHAFPGDGGVPPWALRHEARRRGLDVIAVTNHNQRLAAAWAARLAPPRAHDADLPIVLAGQELTAPRFHMIAAGISRTIDWRLPARDAIRAVHAQGGVAIAAHPIAEGALSWAAQGAEALGLLDGAEAAHPLVDVQERGQARLLDFYRDASAANPSLAPIGSSDFHWGGMMGRCRTFVFAREISERGVLDAIREARTVAFDGRATFIGDSPLVGAAREIVAGSPPPIETPRAARALSALALAAVLLLIVFR